MLKQLVIILCLITTAVTFAASPYPAHWWKAYPTEGKPDWEILPQTAKPGEVILSKRNELGLLSNFAATPFVYHGQRYASVEGFWQMMKYPDGPNDLRAKFPGIQWKYTRAQVAQMTGWDAKNAGNLGKENMVKMGMNWVTFEGKRITYRSAKPGEHYKIIVEVLHEKVKQNKNVYDVLMKTGNLKLKPDHYEEADVPPEWHYNILWMKIRDELRKQK